MGFLRAGFGLLRALVGRVPWEAVLKGKGAQEGWAFFKKKVLQVPEQVSPSAARRTDREADRPG